MATISRQLLICLVIGFFICGIHCRKPEDFKPYPRPGRCESDNDCLKGKARCVRRECYCKEKYAHGDGKTRCGGGWRKCPLENHNFAGSCKDWKYGYCLRRGELWGRTCRCHRGYFGRYPDVPCKPADKQSGRDHPYNCNTDANCPPSSFCEKKRHCVCKFELTGDGENCRAPPPKDCSDDKECTHDQGKCVDGFCRCGGMYAGNGIYCRDALSCPESFTCPNHSLCMVDPLFPKSPLCICNPGKKKNKDGKCVDCLKNADCKQNGTICTEGECTCKEKGMYRYPPCTCREGLVMAQSKCEPGPLHECQADNKCDSRAKCIKGKCFCGESSTGNGKYCRESEECPAEHQCVAHSRCVVDPLIPDNPHCVCSNGYRKTDDGKCVEITECFRKQGRDCPLDQTCNEVSSGSYECTCPKGYEFITQGKTSACQDINECKDPKTCKANSFCVNKEGGFDCKCNDGFKKNDHGTCQAECKCKKHEVCDQGECKCKKPYKKNKQGHCVGSLKAGSAQVSAYLRIFILGVLGSLVLSA